MSQIFPPISGTILQGPVLETFEPQHCLISNVTNALHAEVTTSTPHGYYTGMIVRVIVPSQYGMRLFYQSAIVVTSPTTFTTNLDTQNVDPFVPPSIYPPQGFTQAQVTPMSGLERNIS